MLILVTLMVYFAEYSFLKSAEKAYFKQTETISSLKTYIARRISFKTNAVLTGKQCARCS
jgi:hypothetical protein